MSYIFLHYVDAVLAGLCAGFSLWLGLVVTLVLRPQTRTRLVVAGQLVAGSLGHLLLAYYVGTLAVLTMWLVVLFSAASYLLSESLSTQRQQLQRVNRNVDLLAAQLQLRPAEPPQAADCAA